MTEYLAEVHAAVLKMFAYLSPGDPVNVDTVGPIEKAPRYRALELFPRGEWDRKLLRVANRHVARGMVRGVAIELGEGNKLRKAVTRIPDADGPVETQFQLPRELRDAIQSGLEEVYDQPFWTSVNDTTRKRLQGVLDRSISEGLSQREIAGLIAADPSGLFNRNRAMMIARTETTAGFGAGQFMARQSLYDDEIIGGEEWLAITDGSTRPAHRKANGVRITRGQTWDLAGHKARFPGDPLLPAGQRIFCRCTSTPIDIDEFRDGPPPGPPPPPIIKPIEPGPAPPPIIVTPSPEPPTPRGLRPDAARGVNVDSRTKKKLLQEGRGLNLPVTTRMTRDELEAVFVRFGAVHGGKPPKSGPKPKTAPSQGTPKVPATTPTIPAPQRESDKAARVRIDLMDEPKLKRTAELLGIDVGDAKTLEELRAVLVAHGADPVGMTTTEYMEWRLKNDPVLQEDMARVEEAVAKARSGVADAERRIEKLEKKLAAAVKEKQDVASKMVAAARSRNRDEVERLRPQMLKLTSKVDELRGEIAEERAEVDDLLLADVAVTNAITVPPEQRMEVRATSGPGYNPEPLAAGTNRKAERFVAKVTHADATEGRPLEVEYHQNESRAVQVGKDQVHVSAEGRHDKNTVIHEQGHVIESQVKSGQFLAREWLSQRTEGKPKRRLKDLFPDRGYKDDEVVRDGGFPEEVHGESGKWYVGKDYGSFGPTEVISMGIEAMARNPFKFAEKDPEHFKFTLAFLRGSFNVVDPLN